MNGMRSFTLNGSVSDWPTCLGCALSDRAMGYTSQNRSDTCAKCFQTWCWNGEDNNAAPSGEYEPVVGSLPSFISNNNLSTGSNTSATTNTAPSQSSSTGAAGHVTGTVGKGGLASVALGAVAMLAGASLLG